ncbi:MAG TPA: hypothetical protein VF605_12905 [Allosphingosinicella sp.]
MARGSELESPGEPARAPWPGRWLDFRPLAAEAPVRFSWPVFALFLILCVAVNYPGRLNEDSLEQLAGAADRASLTDVHSPLVAWIWNLPAPALGQPAGALLVQGLLLAFYAAMVPAALPRGARGLAALAIEIVFKLALVVSAGFIIKDILLVGLLLAALAAAQRARSGPRTGLWLAAAAVLLALSLFVRPTNFVMVGTAAALVLALHARSVRTYCVSLFAVGALLLISLSIYFGFNRYVARAHPGHAEIQLFLFDSAGMSARTGKDLFAQLAPWPKGLPDPRQCYTPSEAAIIASWAKCAGYAEAGSTINALGPRVLPRWWLINLLKHPRAYVEHRLTFTSNLLDPREAARNHPVYGRLADRWQRHLYALNRPDQAARFHEAARGRFADREIGWWRGNRAADLFAALGTIVFGFRWTEALSLLACAAVVAAGLRRRWRGRPQPFVASAAAALGIGNVAMHALLGVASQDRYLFPTVCCAAFALIAILRARREGAGELPEPLSISSHIPSRPL